MADNRELIQQILAGNNGAFQTFIERYQRLVSHIVVRMISNAADREDLCQEVFIKVYQNLGGFQFNSQISTWVARIAYNTCLNHLRKKKVALLDDLGPDGDDRDLIGESGDSDSFSPYDEAEHRDLFSRVEAELSRLPVQYRALITMYHLDELTYEEISDATGLPMGTVKSYLYRARKMLKDRMLKKYRLEDIWQQGT